MSEPTYTAEQTSTANLGESNAKVKTKITYLDPMAAKPLLKLIALFNIVITEWPNAQLDLLNNKVTMIGPSKAEHEAALAAGAGDGTELAEKKKAEKKTVGEQPPKSAKKKTSSKIKKPGAGLPSGRNKRKGKGWGASAGK